MMTNVANEDGIVIIYDQPGATGATGPAGATGVPGGAANLATTVNIGNVTSNTMIFQTAPTAIVTDGSIGIGLDDPRVKLEIDDDQIIYRGNKWTERTIGTSDQWKDVAYGNGRFVMISSTTNVATSSDGVNWNVGTSFSNNWTSVTYGNGLFVAVSTTGYSMNSTDGLTWVFNDPGIASAYWLDVTYGDGKFVACGLTGTDRIMYSRDGRVWTGVTVTGYAYNSITYADGKYVVVNTNQGTNDIMYSTDATSWTFVSTGISTEWYGVTYGNGLYVACGWDSAGTAQNIVTSPDGITWTGRNITQGFWRGITYGDGIFVTADATSGAANISTSPDGITWTDTSSTLSVDSLYGIVYGNGLFVLSAVNSASILTSGKHENWVVSHDNQFNGDTLFTSNVEVGVANDPVLFVDTVNKRIGINTSTPSEDVDIFGNVQLNSASKGKIVFYDNGDDHEYGEIDAADDGGDGGLLAFATKADGGSVSNAMVIRHTSNVGIGTTDPLRVLHVNSASQNECVRFESTDTEVSVELKDTTGTAILKCRDDYRFETSAGEKVRITNDGKVGIGNNNPSDRLVVQTDSPNQEPIILMKNDNTTDNNGVYMDFSGKDNATNNIIYGRLGCKYVNHSTEQSALNFYHRDTAGSLVEGLTLDQTGFFGVNETNPLRRMVITGNTASESSTLLAMYNKDIVTSSDGTCGMSFRNDTSNGAGGLVTSFYEVGAVFNKIIDNTDSNIVSETLLYNTVGSTLTNTLKCDGAGQVVCNDTIRVSNVATSIGGVTGSISGATLTINGGDVSYGTVRITVPATSTITTLTASNIRFNGHLIIIVEGSASGTLTIQGSDAGGITNAKVNFTSDISVANNENALLTMFNGNGNIYISASKYL
jgi:hypothetical protein